MVATLEVFEHWVAAGHAGRAQVFQPLWVRHSVENSLSREKMSQNLVQHGPGHPKYPASSYPKKCGPFLAKDLSV